MSERTSPTTSTQRMHQCPSCGMFGDSGYPDNGDACPECGEDFPKEPTHMLVPLASYVALDEVERLQGDLDYLIGVLEGIRDANDPESAPYKAIGALVALTLRAGTDVALAPPPARTMTLTDETKWRAVTEQAIRQMGYAVPFTYENEAQAARLSASVRADYREKYGVDLSLAEIRDACGLPPAREEGVTQSE